MILCRLYGIVKNISCERCYESMDSTKCKHMKADICYNCQHRVKSIGLCAKSNTPTDLWGSCDSFENNRQQI